MVTEMDILEFLPGERGRIFCSGQSVVAGSGRVKCEGVVAAERKRIGCVCGIQIRLREIAECFSADLWIDELEPEGLAETARLDRLAPHLEGRFTGRQPLRRPAMRRRKG